MDIIKAVIVGDRMRRQTEIKMMQETLKDLKDKVIHDLGKPSTDKSKMLADTYLKMCGQLASCEASDELMTICEDEILAVLDRK